MTHLVIAGNYQEFVLWCQNNGFQLLPWQKQGVRIGEKAIFVTDWAQCAGMVNIKIHKVGTWYLTNPLRNSTHLETLERSICGGKWPTL